TVSPGSGSGNGSVMVSLSANTSTLTRSAVLTFTTQSSSGSQVTKMVTVTQTGVTPASDDCGSSTVSYCSWSSLSSAVSGSIQTSGDKDWFRFTAPSSGTWVFTASKPASGGLSDSIGTLYAANGSTVVATDDDSGGNFQFKVQAVLTAGQVYFLEVKGYVTSVGNYTVTATRLA
ncbi:MAG: hypothetical protein FWF25_04460, partial [Propionibacteriaceae bacterium]|nr:hypothetical protein [Propionibacteriaceae bacterium]